MRKPKRYQRKRSAGWRKADHCPDAVYVGRGSKWGNPYSVKHYPDKLGGMYDVLFAKDDVIPTYSTDSKEDAHQMAADMFENDLKNGLLDITVEDIKRELKGKDVLCWCSLQQPCHGDVLIEVAKS
jgi:hypothetical protein